MSKKPLNPVIPDYTPRSDREKTKEVTLLFSDCINCGKVITQGYYGRYRNGGTCSKKCEGEQAQKPLDFGEPE